jgi:hypothetical protein
MVPHEVLEVVELEIDTHLVVLECNERKCKTRVAAEPELEWDVESVLRGAAQEFTRRVRLTAGTGVVAVLTTLDDKVSQVWHVTNHLGIAGLLSWLLGELIPDVEPVTIMFVNALTTDLEFNPVNQVVTNPVEPAELGTRAVCCLKLNAWKSGLEVHAVDQVTVTLDRAGHLVTEARITVEGILD